MTQIANCMILHTSRGGTECGPSKDQQKTDDKMRDGKDETYHVPTRNKLIMGAHEANWAPMFEFFGSRFQLFDIVGPVVQPLVN